MKELGEYLKETRKKHGVNLEEAAEDLMLEVSQLENLEAGNVRAFQDMYTLKDMVKNYAKYLGLEPEKVLDEFNDFLFEHTSKISLTDILEAEAKRKEKQKQEKKISSPYTNIKKQKKNLGPVILTILIIFFLISVIYFIIQMITQKPKIDTELKQVRNSWEDIYEFTY